MSEPLPLARAVRQGLALVVLLSTLIAIAALFRNETCSCTSPAVRYSTIALVAFGVDAVAVSAYAVTGALRRGD